MAHRTLWFYSHDMSEKISSETKKEDKRQAKCVIRKTIKLESPWDL